MTLARQIRALVREARSASLSTLDPDGAPHGSLVLVASAPDGTPILLMSRLAAHVRNLASDSRAALLFDATATYPDPLAGPRITLCGRIDAAEDPELRRRYLARHPTAGLYAGLGDFAIYRMAVMEARFVAGFGRVHRLPGEGLLLADDVWRELAAVEAAIIEHMNREHSAAVGLYANVLLGRDGVGWHLTGLDPEGLDLRRGPETARLGFEGIIRNPGDMREMLENLARAARRRAGMPDRGERPADPYGLPAHNAPD